jgi:hypothetical protein
MLSSSEHACDQYHSSWVSTPVPVDTGFCVRTLKATGSVHWEQAYAHSAARLKPHPPTLPSLARPNQSHTSTTMSPPASLPIGVSEHDGGGFHPALPTPLVCNTSAVALIGDALHTHDPLLAQGAGRAIESAMGLAGCTVLICCVSILPCSVLCFIPHCCGFKQPVHVRSASMPARRQLGACVHLLNGGISYGATPL